MRNEIDAVKLKKCQLEEKLHNLEQKSENNRTANVTNNFSPRVETSALNLAFKCEDCSFSTSTNHGLKVHIGKSHKTEMLRGEDSQLESHIVLETPVGEREEHIGSRLSTSLELRPDLSICKICNINFEDIEDVKNHMSVKHGLLIRCDSCYSCGEVVPVSRIGQFDVLSACGTFEFLCNICAEPDSS